MNENEVNKIIAEYMKMGKVQQEFHAHLYSESLDALVPVWDKLDIYRLFSFDSNIFRIYKNKHKAHWKGTGKTIQQAAAIATARCVQELEK